MTGSEGLSTDIGKSLQWLRKCLLITQYQLATLAHLDYRHYQNIETGRVEVKVETLKRVCTALGMNLSSFFAILDSQIWLRETPSRSKGGGELFVFRLSHENRSFPLQESLKKAQLDHGRDLSEGKVDHLQRSPFPCFEVDRDGLAIWGNGVASVFADARLSEGETRDLANLSVDLPEKLRLFWTDGPRTFFERLPDSEDSCAALMALKPMIPKEYQRLFLACVSFPKSPALPADERAAVAVARAEYKHNN
jgi:transcriptional regulator with XRE-family HTH domain